MRLTPPDNALTLYETGFGYDDFLGRKTAGQRLSELLERVDDPIVVAVEGIWGSGKSYFLKRWVGAHRNENGGRAEVVYFDAFQHDFLDDPLIAIMMAIDERLRQTAGNAGLGDLAKALAAKVAAPAVRIAEAVFTAALGSNLSSVAKAGVDAIGEEMKSSVADYWKREEGRHAAVNALREQLGRLTAPAPNYKEPTRLIVVIDELDRCRPDYALAVLEVIKHFFAAERLHFVLGVNRNALEDMVRTRYGSGVRAGDYLKRFITVSLALPDEIDGTELQNTAVAYFEFCGHAMSMSGQHLTESARLLSRAALTNRVSLRDAEHILREIALQRRAHIFCSDWCWSFLADVAAILKVLNPDIYHAMLFRLPDTSSRIIDFFAMSDGTHHKWTDIYGQEREILISALQYGLGGGTRRPEHLTKVLDGYGRMSVDDQAGIMVRLRREFLSAFELPR